jgi:hypothetical protein
MDRENKGYFLGLREGGGRERKKERRGEKTGHE